MIQLEYVQPENLTDEDIRWLIEGSKGSFDDVTALDQVHAAQDGRAGIHRIKGDAVGIVVLSPTEQNKTLTITCLAGRGLIKEFSAVHDAILATAAAAGASRVNGYVMRAGLAALYKRRTKARMVPMFVEDVT